MPNTILRTFTALALLSSTAIAGDDEAAAPVVDLTKQRLSLEADGAPFVFSGYDLGLAIQPSFAPHLRMLFTHHRFEMPEVILAEGWNARQTALTVQGQYYFRPGGRGWWVGGNIQYVDYNFTRDSVEGTADKNQLEIGVSGGYRWFPFDKGLFLVGWMKVALPVTLGDDAMLGGETAPSRPISIYPSVHLGYEVQL